MDLPYIILIGNVGTGKSTLVEKITGVSGRSSKSSLSSTRESEVFPSSDNSLLISDTPGANSIEDKFEHNSWIAHAMNFKPFSALLIVVKAETRMDNVIDAIRKYAENLLDLAEMLAVCVTHMDQVIWEQAEFKNILDGEMGIEKVIFTSMSTPAKKLISDLNSICCNQPMVMEIDSSNFLKFFKISNSNFKILKSTKREVDEMISIKQQFLKHRELYDREEDKADLTFEFQAWIKEEIIEAWKRVSDENNFTFMGPNTANEAGHIASMTNQLRAVLFEIRNQAIGFQSKHGISELRKCTGCGLIWAKLEGCNGATTCGKPLSNQIDSRRGVMCNFMFERKKAKLTIKKRGEKKIEHKKSEKGERRLGCGRTIIWADMPIVDVPERFNVSVGANTSDLANLPEKASQGWSDFFAEKYDQIRGKMKVTMYC